MHVKPLLGCGLSTPKHWVSLKLQQFMGTDELLKARHAAQAERTGPPNLSSDKLGNAKTNLDWRPELEDPYETLHMSLVCTEFQEAAMPVSAWFHFKHG